MLEQIVLTVLPPETLKDLLAIVITLFCLLSDGGCEILAQNPGLSVDAFMEVLQVEGASVGSFKMCTLHCICHIYVT